MVSTRTSFLTTNAINEERKDKTIKREILGEIPCHTKIEPDKKKKKDRRDKRDKRKRDKYYDDEWCIDYD